MDTLLKNTNMAFWNVLLSKRWRRIIGYCGWSIRILPHLMLGTAHGLCIMYPKWKWHRNDSGFDPGHYDFYSLCNLLHALPRNNRYWLIHWFWKKNHKMGRRRVYNITTYSRSGPTDFLLPFIQYLSKASFTRYSLGLILEGTVNTRFLLILSSLVRFCNVSPSSLPSVIPM